MWLWANKLTLQNNTQTHWHRKPRTEGSGDDSLSVRCDCGQIVELLSPTAIIGALAVFVQLIFASYLYSVKKRWVGEGGKTHIESCFVEETVVLLINNHFLKMILFFPSTVKIWLHKLMTLCYTDSILDSMNLFQPFSRMHESISRIKLQVKIHSWQS